MTPPRASTRRPGRKLLMHDRRVGPRFIAGADEVGRGCLAGPLVAAAVVFDCESLVGPRAAPLGHLDDSKKLTVDTRERLYDAILTCARSWSVVAISPATIDREGLHRSNIAALCRALNRLRGSFEIALVDGFHLPDLPVECRRMVRGDSTSAAIAAASILAKVTRDRLMCRLDLELGERWAFGEHKGYASPLHRERIQEHGVSPIHRRSFDSLSYTDEMWQALDASSSERIGDLVDPLDPATVDAGTHQEDVEPVPAHPVL